MAEERTIEVVEAELRNANNGLAMKQQTIEELKLTLMRFKDSARITETIVRWFRDNYAYDTREAAMTDLLLSRLIDLLDIDNYSDIPF